MPPSTPPPKPIRRRRRLLHLHEHVATQFAAATQLFDHDPPEQSERHQALLGLYPCLVPEGLARLQQQLAFDDLGARALVAHDDHVVDENLRAFANREVNIRAGTVFEERHDGFDDHALVATVAILQIDAIPIARDVDL